MTVSVTSRRLMRWGGWTLTAVAFFFLIAVAVERRSEIADIELTGQQWGILVILALVYGISLMALALSWHLLLRAWGVGLDPRLAVRTFTASQLAKYVPGNVFHYVGRHVLVQREGVAARPIISASGLEALLMVLCASLAGSTLLLVAVLAPNDGPLPTWIAGVAFALSVTGLLLALVIVPRKGVSAAPLHRAVSLYVLFFVSLGIVFAFTSRLISPTPLLLLSAAGVAAWLAGFVVPGAPAGLGVREAALVLLGGAVMSPAELLAVGVLFRGVTFVGDVVCAGLGELIRPKAQAGVGSR